MLYQDTGEMSKDEKYMRWCMSGAMLFSTCSRRHYMSIIIDKDGRISSTGYNGSPPGMVHCKDGGCPRAREVETHGSSSHDNCISVHSEENALLYSEPSRRHTQYINGIPCFSCAKKIAGSGMQRVVYLNDYSRESKGLEFLIDYGIETVEFKFNYHNVHSHIKGL